MFLKSLTLKGFKSFAESTTLELQPGICVVVGPNGSGKSNVVDAIGWVLGAQAPSAVRSQKMDDVIFAGTAKRPALGRAEVSLTIDNSAGLLPIEFSEVTITRTLFRNGDSEYALNGVPCRLLDIQELLSDTGVGRQQHVIISQGQIDAVLNAQPEARRLIIEEAAGILKYRKRKEKAERRLASTETNLTRVQDLLREVRRQLRPLERQAEAARRHDAVAAELHALRMHLAGQQIRRLRARLDQAGQLGRELGGREGEVRARLSELDSAVAAAENELSVLGGDDLGDALARYESLHERARGLTAVLAERRRGLDRARSALVDAAVVATFEAEAARLAAELDDVERDAAGLAADAEQLAGTEAAFAAERQEFQREWADEVPAPQTHAAEARGELGALRAAVDRGTNEVDRLRQRLAALETKQRRLDDEADRLGRQRAEAEAAEGPLIEQLADAQRARKDADAALVDAEERRRASHAESHSWSARAEALALALDEARARAGAARLAEVGGVVGALFDLVEIDVGWEAAFEAAAGEAIGAVVVDDVSAARRALGLLHGGDATGAVLALDATGRGGDRHLANRPVVGEPVRSHVRSNRVDVDRLVDALLGDAVAVDSWEGAVDVALASPGAVVVTPAGDRLTRSGWRVGAGGTGATSAALAEARERAAAAAADADRATLDHEAASRLAEETRHRELTLTRARDQNEAQLAATAQGLSKVEDERAEGRIESESLQVHISELGGRVERDRARVVELESMLPELEAAEAAIAERARAMADARARLDEHAAALGALRSDFDVRAASIDERRTFLRRRLGEVEDRLSNQRSEREEAEARRTDVERQQIAVDRLASYVAARHGVIERELEALRERRRRQSEAAREVASRLDAHRRARVAAEREMEEIREQVRRAELDHAEVKLRLEQAVENLRHDLDCEPEAALASPLPELAEGVTAQTRVRDLERELRLMGPINPLALQEFDALQERHEFLQAQLDDVKTTRRDLAKVIRAVDSEIVSVFAAAYADVESNFRQLVETLFPGGTGRLKLTEPDNLLDTGVEVEARPSGKNVRKLSLLSGGERSLVALAYLFAVFRARPSPFYVMDEVEAALDDVNLHRFLDLIHEFRAEAQLLVVSHQKRTMEAADVLYGVAMQDGGSSKVISERVTAGA